MVAPNSASKTNLKFSLFPKLSFNGFFEVLPSDLALAKTGDSCIFILISTDTATINIEIQKGTLHPHRLNASSFIEPFVMTITKREMNKPRVAVVCIQEV